MYHLHNIIVELVFCPTQASTQLCESCHSIRQKIIIVCSEWDNCARTEMELIVFGFQVKQKTYRREQIVD